MKRLVSFSDIRRIALNDFLSIMAFISSFFFLLFVLRIFLSFHPVCPTQLRKISLHQRSVALGAFSAADLAFTDYSAVEIRMQEDNMGALLISPDFSSDTFSAARCSAIDNLPSGYLHFAGGIPHDFRTLDIKSFDSHWCRFEFEPSVFHRPKRELVFMTIPSNERLGNIVAEIVLVGVDGVRTKLDPTHPSTYLLAVLLSVGLGLFVIRIDRHAIKTRTAPDLFTRRRILGSRIPTTLFLAVMNLPVFMHLVLAKGHFAVILAILSCCMFFWSATRKLTLDRLVKKPRGTKPGILKLRFLVVPVIFAIVLVLILHAKIFISLSLIQNRAAEQVESKEGSGEADTVILCLGGSSTAGTPYSPEDRADYPAQLEQILREKKYPVKVVNAGVNAATTYHALRGLPEMLETIRPDIVTWNYLNNDEGGLDIDGLRIRFREQLGFTDVVTPAERYRLRLTQLVQNVRDIGAKPVFVLEPHFVHVYLGQDPMQNSRRILWSVAKTEGVDVIDPTPVFRRQKNQPLFWDNNVHPTAIGYRLLAETMAENLEPLLSGHALITP